MDTRDTTRMGLRGLVRLLSAVVQTLLFATTYAMSQPASSVDLWEQAIRDAHQMAAELFEQSKASGFDPLFNLGTMHNDWNRPEVDCEVLGRMLDREEYVRNLFAPSTGIQPFVGMTDEHAMEVLLRARSIQNWAYAAEYYLSLFEADRAAAWNLDCIGHFGIPSAAKVHELAPGAKFRVSNRTLVVLGDIEPGFAEQFASQIAANPDIEVIALGSAGGSVSDALMAGQMIRALGLDTILSNACYSACPLVFIGGVNRQIWSPYPELGFHQMAIENGERVSPMDGTYLTVKNYVETMGVDSKFVLSAMFAANPGGIFVPDFQALCDSGVATWVQRICGIDW